MKTVLLDSQYFERMRAIDPMVPASIPIGDYCSLTEIRQALTGCFQIDLGLEVHEHLVSDHSLISQTHDRKPFSLQDFEPGALGAPLREKTGGGDRVGAPQAIFILLAQRRDG